MPPQAEHCGRVRASVSAPASAVHSPKTRGKSLSASGPQFPQVTLEDSEDHLKAQKWACKPHSSLHSWGAYY